MVDNKEDTNNFYEIYSFLTNETNGVISKKATASSFNGSIDTYLDPTDPYVVAINNLIRYPDVKMI